jgi:hypothetical protein
MSLRTALRLLALAAPLLALRAVAEEGAKPPPAAPPAAQAAKPAATPATGKKPPVVAADAAKKKASALTACTERADRIFVIRCQQACAVDAKGNEEKAAKCIAGCGKQPERQQVVKDCMARAGYR